MEGRQQEGVACERKPLACTAVRDSELRAGLLSNVAKKLPSAQTTRAFGVARFPPFHPSRNEPFTGFLVSVSGVPCLVHFATVCGRGGCRLLNSGVTVVKLHSFRHLSLRGLAIRVVSSVKAAIHNALVECQGRCGISSFHLDATPVRSHVADGRGLSKGGPAVGMYRECMKIAKR